MMRGKLGVALLIVGLFGLVLGIQAIQSSGMQQETDDARRVIRPERYP